jgi:hypothetical protein
VIFRVARSREAAGLSGDRAGGAGRAVDTGPALADAVDQITLEPDELAVLQGGAVTVIVGIQPGVAFAMVLLADE